MNEYDNLEFFKKYAQMDRSKKGLKGAGEWHQLKRMLPNIKGKRVLDLGCGYGWHCRYALEKGAAKVVGIDVSARMLAKAKELTEQSINAGIEQKTGQDRARKASVNRGVIDYRLMKMEEIDKLAELETFDCVISSLALHYVASFEEIVQKVHRLLSEQGYFVFSVEHPIFTAEGTEEWLYDEAGEIIAWPVDDYFDEGLRKTNFLGSVVTKYHRTLTSYVNDLLHNGFELVELVEATPDPSMLDLPGMKEELRRPMMLLLSARKK
ncbi:SAM-dependent methyltransferase [Enterococcus sp. JM4C]|uniref:class I SAM-dependent methyltransferase n=1 Tax=Candidatus Enterococcus huntleyi TaxID=1857217 RepID=UPI00137ADE85|nr:class I SAM-dependent methyltransferase [Enterococcus sp. JM4C]KAF1296811.1 SAM-dependent methyltransferase [Enterococcus sp. JM4C]